MDAVLLIEANQSEKSFRLAVAVKISWPSFMNFFGW